MWKVTLEIEFVQNLIVMESYSLFTLTATIFSSFCPFDSSKHLYRPASWLVKSLSDKMIRLWYKRDPPSVSQWSSLEIYLLLTAFACSPQPILYHLSFLLPKELQLMLALSSYCSETIGGFTSPLNLSRKKCQWN